MTEKSKSKKWNKAQDAKSPQRLVRSSARSHSNRLQRMPDDVRARAKKLIQGGVGEQQAVSITYAFLKVNYPKLYSKNNLERVQNLVRRLITQLRKNKVDRIGSDGLSSDKQPTSEGLISKNKSPHQDNESGSLRLPSTPSRLWPGRQRGRPTNTSKNLLLEFIEEVYGDYLPGHKDDLRSYIFQHDKKLYDAIRDFERSAELPPRLQMSNRNERYMVRLKHAEAVDYAGMTRRERDLAKKRLETASRPSTRKSAPP